MSDLVKSKRQARGPPSSPEDHSNHEDELLPDVSATPNSSSSSSISDSSSSSTATPSSTPKPADGHGPKPAAISASPKLTLANIKDIMAKTALDITKDLTAKHEKEMQSQMAAVQSIERKFNDLQERTKTQVSPFETPRTARPEDVVYKQILTTSKKAKVTELPESTPVPSTTTGSSDETLNALLKILEKTTSRSRYEETTTDLPTFAGKDAQWERWYELLRSYFQAKGWLETFDHPIGPGTPDNLTLDFDNSINEKIYQKIQSKCYEGTAATYVRMAAEFDGHGVGIRLRTRYHGYTTQKLESYKKLIKDLRHTSGTSMPLHVDRFETIIGHMPGCGYIPTTTERVEWFLPSVSEQTYAAAKAHCQAKKLTGGLEYSDMIKLYNHTCFEKYPHFQLAELQNSKYNLSQNSNRIGGTPSCIYHPKAHHTTANCDKLKAMNGQPTMRSKGKGKGKPNKNKYGNRSFTPNERKGDWKRQRQRRKGKRERNC